MMLKIMADVQFAILSNLTTFVSDHSKLQHVRKNLMAE